MDADKLMISEPIREEMVDEDGYKFIRIYRENMCLEYLSYRPNGTLISRIVYEWDLETSRFDPINWREYDADGQLLSSTKAIGFDSAGIYTWRIFYDASGKELFRKARR